MCIARPVEGYRGLVETCRQRANELALSRLEIDRLAGLPAGYSGKLLGKEGGALKAKRMWPASLEAILGTLGLQIIIIEDPAATHARFRAASRSIMRSSGSTTNSIRSRCRNLPHLRTKNVRYRAHICA